IHYFLCFQAEDGIRDGHVTGVQTCALPIFLLSPPPRAHPRRLRDVDVAATDELGEVAIEERQEQRADVVAVGIGVRQQADLVIRSEERRVGKRVGGGELGGRDRKEEQYQTE